MHSRVREMLSVLGFTAAYMVVALIAALVMGNNEFLFYIVTMLLIITAIAFVHRRVGLSKGVVWALSIWGLAHMAGGLLPLPASWPYDPPNAVLYNLWLIPDFLKYDQLTHAYGFGVTTCVCWEALRSISGRVRPTFGILTLAAAASIGFGALNEVIEFVATLVLPHTNVGGYINTGWDLVSNLVGAVVGATLLALTSRPAPSPRPDPVDGAGGSAPPTRP